MNPLERAEAEATIELCEILKSACLLFPSHIAGIACLKAAAAQVVREQGGTESMAFQVMAEILSGLRSDAS